jgi:hypothetical protein
MVVVAPPAPVGEVVRIVVAPLFVDVVLLGMVDRAAATRTRLTHSNDPSQHARHTVTVCPG